MESDTRWPYLEWFPHSSSTAFSRGKCPSRVGGAITVKADGSIVGKDFALAPNSQGEYDLAPLGFTFHVVDKTTEGMHATYEHHFVTCDQDAEGTTVRFSMIEDESGGVFWGYGHVCAKVFVAEVNRWMLHVGMDRTELPDPSITPVDHLWAYCTGDDFKLVDGQKPAESKDRFPVTRLWI